MFERVLNPARRTILDRAMGMMLALSVVFFFASIWAFAIAAKGSARPDQRAIAVMPIKLAGGSPVQCTTSDGKVVFVGELR